MWRPDPIKYILKKRYKASLFIAYFQAFSNTYLPFDQFKENFNQAINEPDIIGIAISTRPDCINDQYLDFLQEIQINKEKVVNIESGL